MSARYTGSNPERQRLGAPGHCNRCASVGHVAAHPHLGCSDVGCNQPHGQDRRAGSASARIECSIEGRYPDGSWSVTAILRDPQGDILGPGWEAGRLVKVLVPEQAREVWTFVDTDGQVLLGVDADVRTRRQAVFLAGELLTDRATAPDSLDDGDYHGTVWAEQRGGEEIVITVDFIGGIGLYKLALGIDDEDSQQAAAALQVQLAGIVGP